MLCCQQPRRQSLTYKSTQTTKTIKWFLRFIYNTSVSLVIWKNSTAMNVQYKFKLNDRYVYHWEETDTPGMDNVRLVEGRIHRSRHCSTGQWWTAFNPVCMSCTILVCKQQKLTSILVQRSIYISDSNMKLLSALVLARYIALYRISRY